MNDLDLPFSSEPFSEKSEEEEMKKMEAEFDSWLDRMAAG